MTKIELSDNADQAPTTLPLAEALRLSGLTRGLLLAWERRYGIKPSLRLENGRRIYSDDDVARLKKLKDGVDAGHRIGYLVTLSPVELDALVDTATDCQPLTDFIVAAVALDGAQLAELLRARRRDLGPERFVFEIVLPLLRQVGDLWGTDRLAIAGEHVVSVAVREALIDCLVSLKSEGSGHVALVTTLEGEQHELGALMACVIARLSGASVYFLGPNLPVPEIAAAASRLNARYVLLSMITLPAGECERQLAELAKQIAPPTTIVIGGRNVEQLRAPPSVLRIARLEDLPGILDPKSPA